MSYHDYCLQDKNETSQNFSYFQPMNNILLTGIKF